VNFWYKHRISLSNYSFYNLSLFQVLHVNTDSQLVVLTHKKTLVQSKLPIITNYQQLSIDDVIHVYIKAIKQQGWENKNLHTFNCWMFGIGSKCYAYFILALLSSLFIYLSSQRPKYLGQKTGNDILVLC